MGDYLIILVCGTLILGFIAVLFVVFKDRGKIFCVITKNGNVEELPGVPFYIKQGRYIHETCYLETLAMVSLTKNKLTFDDQDKLIQSQVEYAGENVFSVSSDVRNKLAMIKEAVTSAETNQDLKSFEKAINIFEEIEPYNGSIPLKKNNLQLEKNMIEQSNYVDYGKTFYLNKHQPLFGSSELELEIAADGTLTKTVAKTEERVVEQLMKLLPMESMISKLEAVPEEAEIDEADLKGLKIHNFIYKFSFTSEQIYVRHILFKGIGASDIIIEPPIEPQILQNNNCWYRREIVTDLTKNKEMDSPAVSTKKENEKNKKRTNEGSSG